MDGRPSRRPPHPGASRARCSRPPASTPTHEITYIAHRAVSVTAEKVAINAVMAGCRPEYMPVVVAAVEGIGDPRWSYHGPGHLDGRAPPSSSSSTGPWRASWTSTPGDNLFGPGWRANLTIGRAVRLVMRNVCGSRPGTLDRGTLGHPGKLSYVIAENEAESPWPPLHVERGFRPDQSAVTVVAAAGPRQFYNQLSNTAEGVLTTLADDMRISGNLMGQPHFVVVLAGEHMRTIAGDGWTKPMIREFLFAHTQNSHAQLRRTHQMAGAVQPGDEARMRPLVESPDDILVVAAGGRAGAFSCYIPGWAGKRASQAVTKEVKR